MVVSNSAFVLLGLLVGLSAVVLTRLLTGKRFFLAGYLSFTWVFLLSFTITEFISFGYGIWILALVSFLALREYLSLVDIRLQDRLGVLGAYLAIPFMYYFIHTDWYGMFIVSIPVYAFLAVPLLVTLGGKETTGTVFSIGAIDFGLFLFVYGLGHIGYLMSYAVWMPAMLVLNVALCDIIARLLTPRVSSTTVGTFGRILIPIPVTMALTWLLSVWTQIPPGHSLVLGAMIPPLAVMGQRTGDYVKADLGVTDDALFPGRGQILDHLKSYFFTAPIVFHYIRYFLK